MNAPRTILCAAENSKEYQAGVDAARLGVSGKSVPFKPGSKEALRFVYGFADELYRTRLQAKQGA
jgi:hypothetical protein